MSILKDNSALVAHDAGGANHIISWLKNSKNKNFKFFFHGPARKIFEDNFPTKINCHSIDEVLTNVDYLICGTGWQTTIEIECIKEAKKRNIIVICVLDHWVNYLKRFNYKGDYFFPNKIWVTDDYAKKISDTTFPNIPSTIIENTYAKDILSNSDELSLKKNCLLYVCEPIRSNWGKEIPGEFQAIKFFFNSLALMGYEENIKIKFRIHPSEEFNKYDLIFKEFKKYNISIDTDDIGTSLNKSLAVIACQSYVLHLSIMLKIKTFSSLPPNAPPSSLPHKEIVYLREL